jgi:hypothetical protein
MKKKLGAAALGATALCLGLSSAASADTLLDHPGSAQGHVTTSKIKTTVAKASTSVNLGKVATTGVSCGTPFTGVQGTTAETSPSYTTPFAGVITSFSYGANATPGQVRAVVVVPGVAGHFTVVGKTALQTVTPSVTNTFPTRVSVPAGALLGGQVTAGPMLCAELGVAGDAIKYGVFNPDASNDFAPSSSGQYRWNIAAVIESDVDNDGYGDATQDACPESATTQAACPTPDTIVTKTPSRRTIDQFVKIKFRSTVPGSTFKCSLDGKAFQTCSSPYEKRLRFGNHKVKIQAISPAGIVDPTPAKVKFRIV